MPNYRYRCPNCGLIDLQVPVAERDNQTCPGTRDFASDEVGYLDEIPCDAPLERIPGAPAFTIEGFKASNGYSR